MPDLAAPGRECVSREASITTPAPNSLSASVDHELHASSMSSPSSISVGNRPSTSSMSSPSTIGTCDVTTQPIKPLYGDRLGVTTRNMVTLSVSSAVNVAAQLEKELLREELRQSTAQRKLGITISSRASTTLQGLDTVVKESLSAVVRSQRLNLAETVRIFRNETESDSRPSKALDPERMKFLLVGYHQLSTLVEVATHGISPTWLAKQRQIGRTPKNHQSFDRHRDAALHSIRQGQDSGRYLVVDADILDLWKTVQCSTFGAVEKNDVDPLIEIRLIHDLSFPSEASTNELLNKTCLPEVDYVYVTVLAARIEFLASRFPMCTIKIIKGDVKGAYRHLMTHAGHVHRMAGFIPELSALVVDLAGPFGWSGSPQFYSAFGRAISWLVANNSPATVSDSIDNIPFFGYQWVGDHVMIEVDTGDRLGLAEATLRHSMLAILGPRSINEAKFSAWETRLTVLGLTWDTKKRTLSIPRDKINKGISRISNLLAKGAATRVELDKALGSLRYITTCIRTAKPFFQQLHAAAVRWPRFGRITLPKSVTLDLRWFDHILNHGHLAELPLCMFGVLPEPQVHLYMDASDLGLAVLNPARDEFIQLRFDDEESEAIQTGVFSINVREHQCIALAVWTWGNIGLL